MKLSSELKALEEARAKRLRELGESHREREYEVEVEYWRSVKLREADHL